MHESRSLHGLTPLADLNASAALGSLSKQGQSTPASSAFGDLKQTSFPASASLTRLKPLVNFSATSALEELMKKSRPSATALQQSCDKPDVLSPATLALNNAKTSSSPASAALDEMLKDMPSAPFPSLGDSMNESSRKRVKKGKNETPRRASITSFTQSAKFDTTDLFQALQSPKADEGFDFPTLGWDLGDDEQETEQDNSLPPPPTASEDRRRSLSASCLLGKRPRGLVRSKTMKGEVDRLIHQHQAAFPCTA